MEDRDKFGPGNLIIFYMGKFVSLKELYRGKRVTDLQQLMGPKDTTISPLGRADLLKFGLAGSAVFVFNAIIYTYNEIKKKNSKKNISPTGNRV